MYSFIRFITSMQFPLPSRSYHNKPEAGAISPPAVLYAEPPMAYKIADPMSDSDHSSYAFSFSYCFIALLLYIR